jgi:hypothetical protein
LVKCLWWDYFLRARSIDRKTFIQNSSFRSLKFIFSLFSSEIGLRALVRCQDRLG